MINERTLGQHLLWTLGGFGFCMICYLLLLYFDHKTLAVLFAGLGIGWPLRGLAWAIVEHRDTLERQRRKRQRDAP